MSQNLANKAIIDHCKGRYPREFGTPWRRCRFQKDIINNPQKLINDVLQWNTQRGENTYVSVYAFQEIRSEANNVNTFKELRAKGLSRKEIFAEHRSLFEDIVSRDSAIIDCFYLDFDDEIDPQRAIFEARNVVMLLKNYGVKARCYWSGNKGIAMYIDFAPIFIESQNIKGVVSRFDDYVKNLFQPFENPVKQPLKCLCDSTKDGQSRISRLPNTKHKSSGLYCIPLLEADLWAVNPLEHIRELAKNPRTDIDLAELIKQNEAQNTEVMHALTLKINTYVTLQRAARERADKVMKSSKSIFYATGDWHKCRGVIHAEENGQPHPGREPTADGLILAYKIWGKYPIEKTKDLLKSWVAIKCHPARDFPLIEERIKKFYNMDKTYSPCSFLMKYGHCNGAACSVMRKQGGGVTS